VDPPAATKEAESTPDSAAPKDTKSRSGSPPQKPVQSEPAKPARGDDVVVKKEEVKPVSAAKPEGQVIPPASNKGPQTVTGTEVRQRKTKSSPALPE
jgi:hypothetical protein